MSFLDSIFGGGGQDGMDDAIRSIKGIPLPVLKQMNPELYAIVVKQQAEQEGQQMLGPSASESISLDPRAKQAQLNVLSKLQGITDNNGQDAMSQAANQRLRSDVNQNLQGNLGAIQQNLATRGLSGGMSEMVAKQNEAQNSANRQAQMGLDINAQAQSRALQALSQQGQLGGQIQSNDYNQAANRANSMDAISKFNAQNAQGVQQRNVDSRNSAMVNNAQNQQNAANQNVAVKNSAQLNNNNLVQQDFENQMNKAGALSDAQKQRAALAEQRRQQAISGTAQIIGAGVKAYSGGGA